MPEGADWNSSRSEKGDCQKDNKIMKINLLFVTLTPTPLPQGEGLDFAIVFRFLGNFSMICFLFNE